MRTNEGCWNPKIIDPLKNTATRCNSSCCPTGLLDCEKTIILPHSAPPPDLKPSQRSSALSHGSRDEPWGHTMCPQREASATKRPSWLHLLELSRSSAPAAVFHFHFTFEKLQGHFIKLGNGIQTHAKVSPSPCISSS